MQSTGVLMLIGDTSLLEQGTVTAANDVVTLVTLPCHPPAREPGNTVMVTFAEARDVHVETRTVDGSRRVTATTDGSRVLTGLQLGATISEMIAALAGPGRPARQAPLFCATRHRDGWHVYSRTHQRPGRWCFIRTSATAIPVTGDDLCWLDEAVALHAAHSGVLSTRHCTVPPALAGKEVEIKYTLPAGTAIWPLAAGTHTRMTAGDIPGMVPRFGVDFEMHDFDNHLFDVTAPASQRGYVSFMSVQPGTCWIKRKRFTTDTLIRPETVSGPIRPDQALDIYVRDVLGLDARPLPPFRRVRYDIMLESISTGNHYCIMFDRCTLHGAPDEILVQCEIEYIRSRRVLPIGETLVLDEFQDLTAWCGELLASHGIITSAGYYSKLSFLRDVIRRHPELTPRTPSRLQAAGEASEARNECAGDGDF
ncbi:MAG TPA: hypothetical protein VMV07_05365 [Streptosporangiaceae bacterium]|nr:hypothetical protein [Streptosporangiaceae bacterium]